MDGTLVLLLTTKKGTAFWYKEIDKPSSSNQPMLCLPIKASTVEIAECEVRDHDAGRLPQGCEEERHVKLQQAAYTVSAY
jgi:hypothetical protein